MKTKQKKLADRISHLSPCDDAAKWLAEQKSPAQAWRDCERGDWMLWLLGRLSGEQESESRRKLVGCAAECAELSLPIFEKRYPKDNRVRECIEVCKRWSKGKATIEELRKARSDAAASAAAAAAYAAYAADAAAAAAAAAAYAAYARSKTLSKCAVIVRKHYPKPPRVKR